MFVILYEIKLWLWINLLDTSLLYLRSNKSIWRESCVTRKVTMGFDALIPREHWTDNKKYCLYPYWNKG
jgi:hypothetical protein